MFIMTLGAVYTFPLYFPLIKSQLEFNQQQLNLAGTFYYFCNFIGSFNRPLLLCIWLCKRSALIMAQSIAHFTSS
eukprot:UN15061